MADYTLQGAIHELVAELRGIANINYAPDTPTENAPQYPAAMAYATDGLSINEPANVAKDLHNISIAVFMPMTDYAIVIGIMLPLYEPIRNAFIAHRNSRTSQHYSTFGNITYTLGQIDWGGGQLMYGYVFTIENLKIMNTIN